LDYQLDGQIRTMLLAEIAVAAFFLLSRLSFAFRGHDKYFFGAELDADGTTLAPVLVNQDFH
jgi:hypothetical protein